MDRVVDGIDECKQANGFMMAYKETETAVGGNPNYVRSRVTHWLIEANIGESEKALPLIRAHQN